MERARAIDQDQRAALGWNVVLLGLALIATGIRVGLWGPAQALPEGLLKEWIETMWTSVVITAAVVYYVGVIGMIAWVEGWSHRQAALSSVGIFVLSLAWGLW